jgi:hypothetical protein
VLDRLQKLHALETASGRPFDVYATEYGYQTDPPDPYSGVKLSQQDRWLQDAAYLVWKNKRVREINQFRLTDGAIDRSQGIRGYGEFQSGLMFENFKAKPAYTSFPRPFVISDRTPAANKRVRFWGQVRPGASHTVTLQYRRRKSDDFSKVVDLTTNSLGYFSHLRKARTGYYRYRTEAGAVTKSLSVETH